MYRFYEEYHQKSTNGLVQGDCKQTSVGTEGFVLKNWEADLNTYSDFKSIHPPEVRFKMTKYCSKLTSPFFVWRTKNVLYLRLAYCTAIWCLRCMYTPPTPSSCVSIVFWNLMNELLRGFLEVWYFVYKWEIVCIRIIGSPSVTYQQCSAFGFLPKWWQFNGIRQHKIFMSGGLPVKAIASPPFFLLCFHYVLCMSIINYFHEFTGCE